MVIMVAVMVHLIRKFKHVSHMTAESRIKLYRITKMHDLSIIEWLTFIMLATSHEFVDQSKRQPSMKNTSSIIPFIRLWFLLFAALLRSMCNL